MKKILIIGGAGFIGHNLAIKLNDSNFSYKIGIVDSLAVNNILSIKNKSKDFPHPELSRLLVKERFNLFKKKKIQISKIDSRNYKLIQKKIKNFNPNIIIHLAAVSHAKKSNTDPYGTFDNSLLTLENSLDCAKDLNNLERFIYFSSSMVYGNFRNDFVDEESECNPIGIYGTLKFCCEKIIKAYNQVFNIPYTIIRPSALYGERCISRRVGQIFIENALYKKDIVINTDDNEKLDFTYIDDLVHGIERVIESPNSLNQIFNITYSNFRIPSTIYMKN